MFLTCSLALGFQGGGGHQTSPAFLQLFYSFFFLLPSPVAPSVNVDKSDGRADGTNRPQLCKGKKTKPNQVQLDEQAFVFDVCACMFFVFCAVCMFCFIFVLGLILQI